MKKFQKNYLKSGWSSPRGFTLIEVLVAITVLSVFLMSYVFQQGQNLNDSARMKNDLILRKLCEEVINQVVLDPPEMNAGLTLAPQTKKFEDEYENYQYTIEYRKIEMPDLSGLSLSNNEEQKSISMIQNRIYKQIKNNIEKILWQVAVTVTNLNNEESYTISTWIKDPKEKVRVSL